MAKDPAFLFYSQDFYLGVVDMTFEERGQYITLLCVMHQKGRLPDKTIRLLLGSVSDMVKSKFKIDDRGFWYNERLELETEKRNKYTESRRKNGALGGRPKEEKEEKDNNHKDNHTDNRMANENKNDNTIDYNNNIRDLIKKNYNDFSPEFKSRFTKEQFDLYCGFIGWLDDDYPGDERIKRPINIHEFVLILKKGFSQAEIKKAMIAVMGGTITPDTSVHARLLYYLKNAK